MQEGYENPGRRLDTISDPVFKAALQKYPALLARLDGAKGYDDILRAVELAAVDDGGETVVIDIDGYKDGYEDEEVVPKKFPLESLKTAIELIKNQGEADYNQVREMIGHIPVRNEVIRIWSLELQLNDEDILKD
jgi:hypothetical protein